MGKSACEASRRVSVYALALAVALSGLMLSVLLAKLLRVKMSLCLGPEDGHSVVL